MFGRESRVSPLQLRKQVLIAESELNRAQIFEEWRTLAQGGRDLARQATTVAAWASAAALLVAGVAALRCGPRAPVATKSSWVQPILKGARLAWTIWSALSVRGEREEHK
jgi:hypothetical protein